MTDATITKFRSGRRITVTRLALFGDPEWEIDMDADDNAIPVVYTRSRAEALRFVDKVGAL